MTLKQKYDTRFKDKQIEIINHPAAGTRCKFIEMVETDGHVSGLLMKVMDAENNVYELKPGNVFIVEATSKKQ